MKRILMASVAIALAFAAPAHAAVFTVTGSADTSPQAPAGCTAIQCSLRQAIAAAAANGNGVPDQIVVPAATYTLGFGALAVPSTATGITITGAGAATTIVSANGASRVLTLAGEASVALSGLTLRDGAIAGQTGGNVSVGNTATLVLDHVRVTNGSAASGAGIAATSASIVVISASLIDNNKALRSGGGISVDDSGNGTTVRVQDTTIAFNSAPTGGGYDAVANTSATQLRALTIAGNQGGGLHIGATAPVTVAGSILAGNAPANCTGVAPADGGGNVESGSECGLTGHQNTDPQLAAGLTEAGGQTPALPIAPGSPAVDIEPACLSSGDQREVARPQGAACDAGAFELVPAPVTPPPPAPTPAPTPAPAPKFHSLVVIGPVSGKVLVKLPGSSKFAAVDVTRGIPLGSTVDARAGHVRLTSVPKAGGTPQSAEFWDGIFKVTQPGSITQVQLVEQLAACPKAKASAAAKKPKTRKLWGDGTGSFRTRGQYSAATVRGTKWLVQDSCRQTLTRVAHGVVSVHDDVKRKTVVLRAGKTYIARARRR